MDIEKLANSSGILDNKILDNKKIVNGKLVKSTPKQNEDIQQEINKNKNIQSNAKQEFRYPLVDEFASSTAPSFFSFLNLQNSELKIETGREELYKTYDEMAENEIIEKALEIIANDATQTNEWGNVINIRSDDDKITAELENLFFSILNINIEAWNMFYNVCKYGDDFYEIMVDNYNKPKSVVGLNWLNPYKTERIEQKQKIIAWKYLQEIYDERGQPTGKIEPLILYPWQVLHIKVMKGRSSGYGVSVLRSGIRIYKRLSLLEDCTIVYFVSRAPEKRIFYIPTGDLNKIEVSQFLEKLKNKYKKELIFNDKGEIDVRANVMSITQDFFIPMDASGQSVRIEQLPPGQSMSSLEVLKFFTDKILKLMNIPPAYLGEMKGDSRTSLSQMDMEFGRFIKRKQMQVLDALYKVATIHLYFKGFKKEELYNFELEFTKPSNIGELADLDIMMQRLNVMQQAQSLGIYPNEYILKRFGKHTEKEIFDFNLKISLQQQNQGGEGGGLGGGGMGLDMGGGLGGDMGLDTGGGMGTGGQEAEAGTETETPGNIQPDQFTTGESFEDKIIRILDEENIKNNPNNLLKLIESVNQVNNRLELLINSKNDIEKEEKLNEEKKIRNKKLNRKGKLNNLKKHNELGNIDDFNKK